MIVMFSHKNKFYLIITGIFIFFGCGEKEIPRVPNWAKEAVWYQIFPERFANGDKNNDPTPHDIEGAWPYQIPEGWQISPWTSDWYKLQPWEKANGHDFYWNAGVRRYGGDVQGIIDHLNYLKNLGINAIYLNPVFESPSLHKYDAKLYHHIDNNFGPHPEQDELIWKREDPNNPETWEWTSADSLFLFFINEAHKKGIKVIIDGVFNHVGTSFWAFRDVVKNQQNSLYKDWFKIKSFDNPDTPQNEFEYEGWNGVKDLPEIKKDPQTGLVKEFGEHVHSIVKRWMDPNNDGDPEDGIDGWRLDVAEKVDIKFWKLFRKWVKEINPEAYITGEIWWEDWQANEIFDASPWLQGDAFDGVMNYRFAQAVKKFVIDVDEQISPRTFVDSIKEIKKNYYEDNFLAVQNLMDSHDVDRIASQIINPDRWFDHYANPGQNDYYDVGKPTQAEITKQYLIIGIQMTMPGAPMIYYGDEAGMWGGDDPDCRKPMVWQELFYEPEVADPLGRFRSVDSVKFDSKIFNWYKKLISLRKKNRAFSLGDINFFLIDDNKKVVGYSRNLDKDVLYVFINNKNKSEEVSIGLKNTDEQLIDLINNEAISKKENAYKFSLPPYGIAVLK
jgi:cyclomaltodextrinase